MLLVSSCPVSSYSRPGSIVLRSKLESITSVPPPDPEPPPEDPPPLPQAAMAAAASTATATRAVARRGFGLIICLPPGAAGGQTDCLRSRRSLDDSAASCSTDAQRGQ